MIPTIPLSPEEEANLRARAEKEGVPVDSLCGLRFFLSLLVNGPRWRRIKHRSFRAGHVDQHLQVDFTGDELSRHCIEIGGWAAELQEIGWNVSLTAGTS